MTNLLPKYLSDSLSIYDECGLKYSNLVEEAESAEYMAYDFILDGLSVKFRVAKITPTKTGQFVTLWKRNGKGPIRPIEANDSIDLIVVCVGKENHFGQFVFPKAALIKHKIISHQGIEGKRAMRVYPPWDKTTSPQAIRTQKWQLEFFLEIPHHRKLMQKLYSTNLRSQ